MALDPTIIALIGTLMGGVGLKLAEHWLGRNRVKIDDATQLRDELRLELTALREENRQLEATVDKWRQEYYELLEKFIGIETELKIMKNEMEKILKDK